MEMPAEPHSIPKDIACRMLGTVHVCGISAIYLQRPQEAFCMTPDVNMEM
jgi:hypothetical protein